jgi:hypothetical protein
MGTSLVTLVGISMTLVINIDIVPEKIPGVNGPSSDSKVIMNLEYQCVHSEVSWRNLNFEKLHERQRQYTNKIQKN